LPIFISLYYAIRGEPSIADSTFLGIPLGEPSIILLVLYVITQIISTELMLVTQTDKMQKMIMRAMPIIFVIFLWNFPAGLFVYWITTNLWTIGQQLIIRRTMPKAADLAARAKSKPKKRSRFMEMMMASQSEAMKQREAKMAQKGKSGAKEGGGAAKQGTVAAGKKTASGGRKPPPGKGKRKPGQQQSGKPSQSGKSAAGPKGSGGGQKSKPRPADTSPAGTSGAGDGGATSSSGGPAGE
jgi:hypothetical protein